MKRPIETSNAPRAIGPYSQAVAVPAGEMIFCSGQIGLDPATGKLVEGGVEAEARRALANLSAVLEAAGLTPSDVVKTTIFLAAMSDFAAVNAIYAERFGEGTRPARSTVAAAGLPLGARIEIDAIAVRSA
jgi:2-iminobutanoate/2-iminopropanoate deaminase